MSSTASDEFRDLQNIVRQSGLLAKQPLFYVRKIIVNFVMLIGAFALVKIFRGSWMELGVAAFLAFVFAQLGFVVHDAGHQEIFSGPTGNEVLGLVHSNLILGFSYSWWLNKHNRHHCTPNHITADPDVDLIPFAFSADQVAGKRGLARFSVKYQHFSFFPLSMLEAFVLKYDSVHYLLHNKVKHPILEVSFLLLHCVWYFGLLIFLLGPLHAILFMIAHQAFLGLFLTLIFAPNHQGMPLAQGATAVNYLREQVLTSRNIKERPGIDFCLGGLGCQIEHHLFPTMPTNKLRQVQKIVKSYCLSRGVPYHETSLFQSYREVYQNLREISLLVSKEPAADIATD
jgi:fatty acid desaturase